MKYAIVTPAKNEEKNIENLFESVANQTTRPKYWIFVNDSSDDNTGKLVTENINRLKKKFKDMKIILHNNIKKSEYDLKIHYSEVVKIGFDIIEELLLDEDEDLDYIGILDADLFPEKHYYENLIAHMVENKIDICSGNVKVIIENKSYFEKVAKDWPRGGCRLYNYDVYKEIGFTVSRSPDTYTCLKAQIKGYNISNCSELYVESFRETGSRHAYKYYGESDRYFGYTRLYAMCKFMYKFFYNPCKAIEYIKGYMMMKEIISDNEIRDFVKNNCNKKILKKLT